MSVDKKSSYYDAGGIETIDIMKAKLTPEQYEGYLLGNIIKYSSRCNFKGSKDRDIEKVAVYAELLKQAQKNTCNGVDVDWKNTPCEQTTCDHYNETAVDNCTHLKPKFDGIICRSHRQTHSINCGSND